MTDTLFTIGMVLFVVAYIWALRAMYVHAFNKGRMVERKLWNELIDKEMIMFTDPDQWRSRFEKGEPK